MDLGKIDLGVREVATCSSGKVGIGQTIVCFPIALLVSGIPSAARVNITYQFRSALIPHSRPLVIPLLPLTAHRHPAEIRSSHHGRLPQLVLLLLAHLPLLRHSPLAVIVGRPPLPRRLHKVVPCLSIVLRDLAHALGAVTREMVHRAEVEEAAESDRIEVGISVRVVLVVFQDLAFRLAPRRSGEGARSGAVDVGASAGPRGVRTECAAKAVGQAGGGVGKGTAARGSVQEAAVC